MALPGECRNLKFKILWGRASISEEMGVRPPPPQEPLAKYFKLRIVFNNYFKPWQIFTVSVGKKDSLVLPYSDLAHGLALFGCLLIICQI